MLPPKDIDTGCLMEVVMTGDRTLKLCAADPDQARFVHLKIRFTQPGKLLPAVLDILTHWRTNIFNEIMVDKYQNNLQVTRCHYHTLLVSIVVIFFRYTVLLQDVEDYVLLHAWVFTKTFT
jgi:hypothetical protein